MKSMRMDWLPDLMPGVQALMDEMRRDYGRAWVAQCWRGGVQEGRGGCFWAAEGSTQVGVPWDADLVLQWLRMRADAPGLAMVCIADPKGAVTRHVHLRLEGSSRGA